MIEEKFTLIAYEERKKCSKCGSNLPLFHFHRKRKSKDTYQSYCIKCEREYKRHRRIIRQLNTQSISNMTLVQILESRRSMDTTKRTDTILLLKQIIRHLEK